MVEHVVAQVGAEAYGSDGGMTARQGAADQTQQAQRHQQQAHFQHITHVAPVDAVIDEPAHVQGDENVQNDFQRDKDGRENGVLFILADTGHQSFEHRLDSSFG